MSAVVATVSGMNVATLTARQLPEIRAELTAWLADPNGGAHIWSRFSDGERADRERAAAGRSATHLRGAELYYVAEDLTALAAAAGASLPSYRLSEQDIPAASGLVVWQKPITERRELVEVTGCPVLAASWGPHRGGVEVRWWVHLDDWLEEIARPDPALGHDAMGRAEIARLRRENPAPLVSTFASHLRFGQHPSWLRTDYDATPADERADHAQWQLDMAAYSELTETAERTLVSTWLLMGQTLVREERERPPRSSERRIARLSPSLASEVRCVQLRRGHADPDPKAEVGAHGRTRSHQWIVSGHWRNHWYPARGDHRPIWIAPHMKGPDGAPLLDPAKLVHVLRR